MCKVKFNCLRLRYYEVNNITNFETKQKSIWKSKDNTLLKSVALNMAHPIRI